MRKYASRFLLDVFLSVVATVAAGWVTHHYFPSSSPVKVTVSAEATGGSNSVAGAPSEEPALEHVAASAAPSDVVSITAPATIVADRAVEANHDETVGPSLPAKSDKPANIAARKRPVPRDKGILKTMVAATPEPAQPAVVPPEPSRAASERANPSPDAPQSGESWAERDVTAPPGPETRKLFLSGLVLKPIIRTVVAVRARLHWP
jgi:hypothetical protein